MHENIFQRYIFHRNLPPFQSNLNKSSINAVICKMIYFVFFLYEDCSNFFHYFDMCMQVVKRINQITNTHIIHLQSRNIQENKKLPNDMEKTSKKWMHLNS